MFHMLRMPMLLTVVICLSLGFSVPKAEHVWVLAKEKEGVKIYKRETPNSNLKQMRMLSKIKGNSLASFAALFQDLEDYDKWVYSCERGVLLKKISDNEIIYYIHSNFPWPLDNRDFVLKNAIWQDPHTMAFHSKSVAHNNFYQEKKGVIRVKVFEAEWIITPLGDRNYSLKYTFSTDPAGDLPAWVINSFMDLGPLNTIQGMERHAKSEKYAKARFGFIKE